jgi:hypothetical protein
METSSIKEEVTGLAMRTAPARALKRECMGLSPPIALFV